jgi:hypothetical protein
VAGLRFNQWVAVAFVVGGAVALAVMRRHPSPEPDVSGREQLVDEAVDIDSSGG